MDKKKLVNLLEKVYNCVYAEEHGSAEHISEYVSSDEIKNVIKDMGYKVGSNLTDGEINEAVMDYIKDNDVKFYERSKAMSWADKTDMNEEAKEVFLEVLQKELDKQFK